MLFDAARSPCAWITPPPLCSRMYLIVYTSHP
ncbi:hypothetical protein LEMLEM_LOCUS6682, partial [Lemmus lemmus]